MAVEWENGIPILTGESLLSDVPEYTQALAAASIMPVGAIMPYMGEEAPDYWLICDGSEYDPDDLPELWAVNNAFHVNDSPSQTGFRVPDLRGRAPFGVAEGPDFQDHHNTPSRATRKIKLGVRFGDHRLFNHRHNLQGKGFTSGGEQGAGHGDGDGNPPTSGTVGNSSQQPKVGEDTMPPYTGVNFIVYAGRATKSAGVQPIDSLAPKSNLEMVLQRIELSTDAEEIKMLKEQLATLKENHA